MTVTDLLNVFKLLAVGVTVIGLCIALAYVDQGLDYLISLRRMWRHLYAALPAAGQQDTPEPATPAQEPLP
jgi:hypothetical protein